YHLVNSGFELDRDHLWQHFRQLDNKIATPVCSEIPYSLPLDDFHVATLELEAPWEVAHVVVREVLKENDSVPGDEVVVRPRPFAGLDRWTLRGRCLSCATGCWSASRGSDGGGGVGTRHRLAARVRHSHCFPGRFG